jgi:hypothetical protein
MGFGFGFLLAQIMDSGHGELAVLGLVIEIRHLAIHDETDALSRQPSLQGKDQGIVLVVDGSLDPGESFNAGKLEHETEEVTLELHGFVEYGLLFVDQRGNRFVKIPGALVVVGCQHAPAAHGVPAGSVPGGVQAAAHDGRRFEDRNIPTGQAAIADHEGGGGQGTDAATDQIGL